MASTAPAAIRHAFLAVDESRHQLLYVNEADPSKDWVLPGTFRDIQPIGDYRILVSTETGYREYDFRSRKLLREVTAFSGVVSARRMLSGKTLLACNQDGVTVYELDAQDKVLRRANFKTSATRLVRLTPQGTFLFGTFFTDHNQLIEADLDGRVVKSIEIPHNRGTYQALRKPDGHLLLSAGYDGAFWETDAEGKILKTFGGLGSPEARTLGYFFFAGFQVLPNGNTVVTNWTGHGAGDSVKGVQIVEFDPQGKVIWTWHEAKRAGSILGVIVLDDLSLEAFSDDVHSVLSPIRLNELPPLPKH